MTNTPTTPVTTTGDDAATPATNQTRPGVLAAIVGCGILALIGLNPHPETFGEARPYTLRDETTVADDPTFDPDRWLWLSVIERNTAPLAPLVRPFIPQTGQTDANGVATREASWRNGAGWALTRTGDLINQGTLVHHDHRPDLDLRPGDVIVTIDAAPTPVAALANRVLTDAATSGMTAVEARVWRDDTYVDVTIPTGAPVDLASLGGESMAAPYRWAPDQGHSVGGSAGLLFALATLDAATSGDLTGGRVVGATGVMYPDGTTGPIAGTDYKLDAAFAAGADVVFVAAHSDPTIRWANDPRVVIVATADDAVTWLCAHGGTADGICP